MPIKQIQLRGISRTPSDRATADGGCAESMNVHLDQQETAPTLPPDDVSDAIYGEVESRYPVFFIHKMTAVTNYIATDGEDVIAYGELLEDGEQNLFSLDEGESVSTAVSNGNTLVVYTNMNHHYILYKDGGYEYLGAEIPSPAIEVITRRSDHATYRSSVSVDSNLSSYDAWNDAKSEDDQYHPELLEAIQNFWDKLQLAIGNRRADGIFCAPFFVIYALKMYDGSYVNASVPILCGAAESLWITADLEEVTGVSNAGFYLCGTLTNLFKVRARLKANNLAEWRNTIGKWATAGIITSIDFFASTPIYTPALYAAFDSMDSNNIVTFKGIDANDIKDAVLDKTNFYKIKTFALDDDDAMLDLIDGSLRIENSDEIGLGEKLVTKDVLPYLYRTGNQYIASGEAINFNKRSLLAGIQEKLTSGLSFLNGQVSLREVDTYTGFKNGYIFRFRLNDNLGQSNYVVSRYGASDSDGIALFPAYLTGGVDDTVQQFGTSYPTDNYYITEAYSWIAYPDSRCDLVEVWRVTSGGSILSYKSIPMQPHPSLQCSYAFFGFGVTLSSIINGGAGTETESSIRASESRFKYLANKLLLSEFENPYLFTAGNILTFSDNIVGVGVTSAPLSEGQVGDFDLYVFTEGGIRILKTNSDGTFSGNNVSPTNLSRHVAIQGTITALEQAIVFITKKGVMLLSGGTVTELSGNMNGIPYLMEDEILTLLGSSQWGELVPDTEETLMDFMTNAKIAYDNNGARLIFFNPEKKYQYVYMLETQTWHKMFSGLLEPTILNSYPDCLVSASSDGTKTGTLLTITAIPSTLYQQAVAQVLVNYGLFENVSAVMGDLYSLPFICDVSAVQDVAGMETALSALGSVEYSISTGTVSSQVPGIYDFSSVLDDADLLSDSEHPVRGIIVTRPFDLGEPDIRKAITQIRIRGRYNRGDVKYILMGTFDGIHWKRLRSLRGGSFKMFRMILLTALSPTERISWIDIDYESRFTNRLR